MSRAERTSEQVPNYQYSPELLREFVELIYSATLASFAPGPRGSGADVSMRWTEQLNTACPATHFLGRRLGCSITRWFFYELESTGLAPFRDRFPEGIDPAWIKIKRKIAEDEFEYQLLSGDEKNALDKEVARQKHQRSAHKYYDWFSDGGWVRTQSEAIKGWVFVALPEIALGCFEWLLREALTREHWLSSPLPCDSPDGIGAHSVLNRERRLAQLAREPRFARTVRDTVLPRLLNSILYDNCDAQDGLMLITDWLRIVLRSSPTLPHAETEYREWFCRDVASRHWFTHPAFSDDELHGVRTWEQLALTILKYDVTYSAADPLDEALTQLSGRLRFSPAIEMILHTRNLLFFPFWLGEGQDTTDSVKAPYCVFVIASLFDSGTVTRLEPLIRPFFLFLSLPNLLNFTTEVYRTRTLLRGLGHELYPLLDDARSQLDVAKAHISSSAETSRRNLDLAYANVDAAIKFSSDVRDSISSPLLKLVTVRPALLINRAIAAVERSDHCRGKRVQIRLVEVPDADWVLDAEQIQRCMVSLLKNAVEAAPRDSFVEVSGRVLNNRFEFEVRDSGPGIPDDVFTGISRRQRVSTKFASGTRVRGIGLTATRSSAEAHGGSLEFRERGTAGTRVVLAIPLQPETEG